MPTIRPTPSASDKCCGAQPVRPVAEPLSSIACKKVWPSVGFTSPAQASHSAAGISAIAGWTVSVTVSAPLAIGSGELKHRFDFDRDSQWQGTDADRGAGMLAGIAEYLDHQIGGAVDDLRHLGELGGAVDEPAEAKHPLHLVEVAAAGDPQMRQDVEGAEPGGLLPIGDADPGAELADEFGLAVAHADLARHDHEIARAGERYIIRDRRGHRRQLDAELDETRLDPSAHRYLALPALGFACSAPRAEGYWVRPRCPACRETALFAGYRERCAPPFSVFFSPCWRRRARRRRWATPRSGSAPIAR